MRLSDLIGKRFGMLVVVGRASKSRERQRRALLDCLCDCGRHVVASKAVLEYGSKTNCGCVLTKYQRVDLTGKKFGRLLVVRKSKKISRKRTSGDRLWDCLCDCGTKVQAFGSSLRDGRVKSCGCLRREVSAAIQRSRRDVLRVPFAETIRKNVLRHYKNNAEERGLDWKLTKSQFNELVYSNCYYCGSLPKEYKSKYGKHKTQINGIDRVDNSKGYTSENCVPCCKICNYAKNDMGRREFFEWVTRVYARLLEQKGKI